ncbi:uncharacterized protein LOC101863731 [Aplysia californica]|uniref:Uncharacterized protein LOC101863731 n=1 Tax=Aplysia californica TaxID=6500 RepID=A0ABM0ZVM9_APLCA|nr:uncharacterized protein LOC101863731 [Aplysia californica]
MAELDRTHKKPRIRLIGSLIKLTVTAGKPPGAFTLPTIPCHKIQPNQTWTRQSPNGFLFNDKWNFLSCQRARSRNCFQNLTLYVLGDSNSRHHYNSWCKLINAVQRIKQTIPAWHSPLECSKPSINFFSRWDPHASPFTVSMGVWTLLGTQIIPSSHVIDSIPAKTPGRVLLVLHHYFHLTMHHVTAFHNMVIASRDAVARLLDRNPNVQVLVQGPHVTYVGWDKHYVAGDGLARFMEELLVQEYRPLRDRVIYLRTWDLTLASENFPYHPRLQRTIDDLILDLMCGR